jgi:glycosyltransferase involved in cell wall biosynthesis
MKILVVHNEYQYRGGEDAVVEAETALLRNQGHTVGIYRRSNHEFASLSRINAAASTLWSHRSATDIRQTCATFNPDVIHVHNTFPLISPSLYWAAARERVPVVQTLHNFRLLCPQATFMRDGKVCQECVGKLPWRAVTRKCYRKSALLSAVTFSMLATHRSIGTFQNQVGAYIALTNYSRQMYIEGGLPADKIYIKPNFVCATRAMEQYPRDGGLFIGRLSEEKGLHVLAEAIKQLDGIHIAIAGSGPLQQWVAGIFGSLYLGPKTREELTTLLSRVRYLVVPSTGIETFGMVVIEAFACGTPVIASRHGGLCDLVRDGLTGLLVNPSDAHDLAEKIAWAESHPEQMRRMGQAARRDYELKYTPARNYELLMKIYDSACRTCEKPRSVRNVH